MSHCTNMRPVKGLLCHVVTQCWSLQVHTCAPFHQPIEDVQTHLPSALDGGLSWIVLKLNWIKGTHSHRLKRALSSIVLVPLNSGIDRNASSQWHIVLQIELMFSANTAVYLACCPEQQQISDFRRHTLYGSSTWGMPIRWRSPMSVIWLQGFWVTIFHSPVINQPFFCGTCDWEAVLCDQLKKKSN